MCLHARAFFYTVLVAQFRVAELLLQSERLGLRLIAGPATGAEIERVEVIGLDALGSTAPGSLAIVAGDHSPAPYLVDVAVRQASALALAGLVFSAPFALPETAGVLAARGEVPLLAAEGLRGTDLAFAIDRLLSAGTAESMTRAAAAIERATAVAAEAGSTAEGILAAASAVAGETLSMQEDPLADPTQISTVFIGEVPVGRIVADAGSASAAATVPVVAALVSRTLQRQLRERFAPTQSRADLIVELVLAEAARVDAFVAPAARLGLPLQLSHATALLRPRHRNDPELTAPHAIAPAVELFALQLVEEHPELWHIAHFQDDLLIVSTEEHGASDHQRRLRAVAVRIQRYAQSLAGSDWSYTLGLGTPNTGATGLRQSLAEARVAVESAIAAGRLGGVQTTDVTGLRRVLLDLYASPMSRGLLQDVLHPLDALGPQRAMTAVRTLLAYLSTRNSLGQAATRLMLHPNAVGYRMRWIRETLDLDLDDPDVRFAVELACRVRLLGETTHGR